MTTQTNQTQHFVNIAQEALEELKGQDICLIDVRGKTSMTDYMLIASGASNRQVKALAQNVLEKLKEAGGQVLGSEGFENSEWALLDFGDLIIHVMQQETRQFYDLEHLWQGVAALRTE